MSERNHESELLKEPVQLGPYLLIEKVASGGMADVFKARSFGAEGFQRIVAVKRIKEAVAEDSAFIRMFINEAKIASQLQHSNIAQIFDLGRVNADYYIAMEYVSGSDLGRLTSRLAQQRKQLPTRAAVHIATKICEGLDYAHERKNEVGEPLGIIHRDVSPSNILLSYDGEVKLIDFGVAKAAGSTAETQVGILKGKLSYMSPEQVRGSAVDRRSDTFAVGIILYEILTGERLFLGATDFETLERIRKVEIVPPSLYNPDIPPELEAIVLKALERNPEQRYQTAAALLRDLQRWQLTQAEPYDTRSLADLMQGLFSQEIEQERQRNESIRERFQTMSLTPIQVPPAGLPGHSRPPAGTLQLGIPAAPPRPPPYAAAGIPAPPQAGGLSWDDDESETQVFGDSDEDLIIEEETIDDLDIVEDTSSAWTQAPSSAAAAPQAAKPSAPQSAKPAARQADAPGFEAQPSVSSRPTTARGSAAAKKQKPSGAPAKIERLSGPQPAAPAPQKSSSSTPWIIAAILFAVLVGGALLISSSGGQQQSGALALKVDNIEGQTITVSIDGEVIATGTTQPIRATAIDAGVHQLRIEAEGYEAMERDVRIIADQSTDLELRLVPSKVSVELSSSPAGAQVSSGGEQLGTTPFTLEDQNFGETITLVFTLDGYEPSTLRHRVGDPAPEAVALSAASIELTFDLSPRDATARVLDAEGETVEGADEIAHARTLRLPAEREFTLFVQAEGHESLEQTFQPERIADGRIIVELPTLARGAVAQAEPQAPAQQQPAAAPAAAAPAAAAPARGTPSSVPIQRPATEPERPAAASAPARPTVDREAIAARAQQRREATQQAAASPQAPARPQAQAPAAAPAAAPPAAAAQPAAAEHGFLNIRSSEPMQVFVNGANTGATTPVSRQPIAPGRYRIELKSPSTGASHAFSIQISSGQTRTLIYPPN